MTGDEVAAWLAGIFPGLSLSLVDARPVALTSLNGLPVAVTAGFSGVDTGLVMQGDQRTEVRCEIVCRADADPHAVGEAVVAATRMIERLGVPAQPGVLLEDLAPGKNVRHGLLREPELFERGTPIFNEPGRMTLLLELVMLTGDEFEIVSERGYPALATRLRRRGARVSDWGRDAD
ncbi:suppressor of fused domain protein [Corynebacterium qintianiae]|uniref:Suppressor of fused domain protein n=1 Tax=Corynebacterium qintianiae TaxID=2709392 RepID=A0A7T0PDX3_9CORY|nr:suppressor of fused domain protein [Corynebacterium qintianiae]QPK83368.1 suppressor of fused domain protein [Corynebacterium qintianiae]